MRKLTPLLLLIPFSVGLWWGCQKPSGLERPVHPDDWLWLHGEKAQTEGTTFCMRCHPPEGNWPDAPTCTSCHPTQP